MKKGGAFLVLTAFFILSCTSQKSDVPRSPVMAINGEGISAALFAKALARKLKMYDALAAKDPTTIKKARELILRDFVVSTLISQYARSHDLRIDDKDLLDEMERVRKTYPDDLTFKAALATEGQSMDEWKTGLKQTLLERKAFALISPPLSPKDASIEKELRALYEEKKNTFQRPAQVHIQQIVVTREDDAERLLHKLKSGAPFATLAQKFSISPDGANGGDIGFVSKGVTPAFDSAFNMKPGQISAVIKSSYGFHIIKLLDKRAAGRLSYEDVKERLLRELSEKRQQGAFNAWLETAIKSAKIERNDALLDKIRVRTEGENE